MQLIWTSAHLKSFFSLILFAFQDIFYILIFLQQFKNNLQSQKVQNSVTIYLQMLKFVEKMTVPTKMSLGQQTGESTTLAQKRGRF